MCTKQIETPQEVFAEKLLTIMNHGALALMTSIGHRTGLFDTMSQLEPATSEQIAESAGLNERYVREWLGAMTVGGVVECHVNGGAPQFSLPAERAAFLTRAAGADNLGVFAQYFAVLGSVEDRVVECFKNGGGVSYSEFKRFHEVMAEDSGQSVMSSLIDVILPIVPRIVAKLEKGIDVLDLGCGSGRALNLMARTFPKSLFVGYDFSEPAIQLARDEASDAGLENLRFEVRDLTTFDDDAPESSFDFITTFDAIHDQARPDRVLAGIYKALKPAGVYLMQDIAGSSHVHHNYDHPLGALLYTVSTMHCMTVSLAQGGMGLGAMWGKEQALAMLREAGFHRIDVKTLDHDVQNYYYIIHKA
jgi:2-polyprenyl-3-methyl-5-hydroxy-6-metoxy-1,4-benzoquinol methylase